MSRRPPNRSQEFRQVPTLAVVPGAGAPPVDEAAGQPEASAFLQKGMADIQRQFQSLLENDTSLDVGQREHMGRFFEQALQDAAASPTSLSEDVFDTNAWRQTVDQLRLRGDVDQDEADHLIRSLNDALAPLERRESKLAIEFSRRLETEGEEKAIAWLRSQPAHDADVPPKAQPHPAAEAFTALRTDVVNSRSRRLRGPPK